MENSANVFRFEVGQHLATTMLYGGIANYEVVTRTDNTVTVRESHISEDTGDRVFGEPKTYDIELLDAVDFNVSEGSGFKNLGKCEAFRTWTYYDHVGYCFAKTGVC